MVFIHGWTLNLTYWNEQVEYFSKNYTTYTYDWRGMGESSHDTAAFSMGDLALDLVTFIETFKIKNPIVVGHSEGGAIAVRYAVDNPTSLKALILADTSLNTSISAIEGVIELELTKLFKNIERIFGKNYLIDMIPNLQKQFFSEDFIQNNPKAITAWQKQFVTNSIDSVINGLQAWELRKSSVQDVNKIQAPTLMLWGLEDAMIKLFDMQQIQENLSQASQLSILPGAGHMTPVEIPGIFNRTISDFLDFEFFKDTSKFKYLIYCFQEWSGFSSF
jgi:pimeloyl-ACP methyl ester carboxylesterase